MFVYFRVEAVSPRKYKVIKMKRVMSLGKLKLYQITSLAGIAGVLTEQPMLKLRL